MVPGCASDDAFLKGGAFVDGNHGNARRPHNDIFVAIVVEVGHGHAIGAGDLFVNLMGFEHGFYSYLFSALKSLPDGSWKTRRSNSGMTARM